MRSYVLLFALYSFTSRDLLEKSPWFSVVVRMNLL